jgi:HAD superfamily hydrolase (TIGR01490 family)
MKVSYAFFDVDGTLLRGKSMFEFHDFWYQRWLGTSDPHRREEYEDASAVLRTHCENTNSRRVINLRYYELFAGRQVDEVQRCAQAWASGKIADPTSWVKHVVAEMQSLRDRGIQPVLVSGSFVEALQPIAQHLGVHHILATRLLHDGVRYCGRIKPPPTIGPGKADAIRQFAIEQAVDLESCWAYGDDISDLDMLEAVGNPVAVVGDPLLQRAANERAWRHISANPS